ncbi:MAG TPA: hemerythrin domain-containing protein [Patescibacteria group bacterium]|nr:hemerythrin domain-containing protein [Patescibacteria group bacterium]
MTSKTASFRQHHTDVRALVVRIEALLTPESVRTDAGPIATVVRELFGKFGVHLSIEDATLYPRMLAHADHRVRLAAQSFQGEMGNLKVRFDEYRHRWPGPMAISQDPSRFVTETADMLAALKRRIAHEDTDLYDLYDQAA